MDGRNKSGHDELTDADAPGSEPPVPARVHSDQLEQHPTTARQRMEHLSYPNESKEYRAARNALLDEEIALRAQIEAVAAKRRALPPGGEVAAGLRVRAHRHNADAGAGEDVETVRAARHADPLQLHVRAGARKPVPRLHASARRHRRRCAALARTRGVSRRREIADRAARRLGARTRLGAHVADLDGGQQLRRRLLRRHLKVFERNAPAAPGAGWGELGRDDLQRVQKTERHHPPLLGLRTFLRAARAGPAPPRRRHGRSVMESARHDARGAGRGLVSEGGVLSCRPLVETVSQQASGCLRKSSIEYQLCWKQRQLP